LKIPICALRIRRNCGWALTCEQHPDADRLKVTTVDIGTGTPVVCGAANAASGQNTSQQSEQYYDKQA
jgi:tRNA-binding EMAP/Myf-like protein